MSMNLTRRGLLRSAGAAATFAATSGTAELLAGELQHRPETVTIAASKGRRIDVTRWRPPSRRRGTILFSHGANSSPVHYDLLILPWVAAGYDVWAPLHVDSAAHPDRAAFTGASGWAARIEDMRTLADHVGARRYVAAGHSYGGLVALTLGGASPVPPPGMAGTLSDARAQAVVAFSPPGLMPGLVEAGSYASVSVPALVQTGTRDFPYAPGTMPADPEAWRAHLRAYEEPAAGGDRYALIIDGVDHYFGGAICNFDRPGPRQTREAGAAADIARLFIDAQARPGRNTRKRLEDRIAAAGPVTLLRR